MYVRIYATRLFLAVVLALQPVAVAKKSSAAGFDRLPPDALSSFDRYGRQGDVAAMAYIKVPFQRNRHSRGSGARLGLGIRGQLPAQYLQRPLGAGYAMSAHDRRVELIDFSVGLDGRSDLKLNNLSLREIEALYADEGGEAKGGLRWWHWALIGTGAVMITVLIVAETNPCLQNIFSPECQAKQ